MAKYAKDDCRFFAKNIQAKHLFSPYPQMVEESEFVGDNRKERRGIMARFRAAYGKKAFFVARERAKKIGVIDTMREFAEWFFSKNKANKKLFEKHIVGHAV